MKKIMLVPLLTAAALVGCTCVKDTSGIKRYVLDQARAERLAVTIKAYCADTNSPTYKRAEWLFNRAAGYGTGWANGVILDAKTKGVIDVPISTYEQSETARAIAEFLALDPGPPNKSLDPVFWSAVGGLATEITQTIMEQRRKTIAAAIATLEEQLKKVQWTSFENTTEEWINHKYGLGNTPK